MMKGFYFTQFAGLQPPRGVSRISTTSKIELFKTLINGSKPLTNDKKSSISDVTGVLDTPPKMYFVIGTYQEFSQHMNEIYF